MNEHPLLRRQLRKLGLTAEVAPDAPGWQAFVECVSRVYHQGDLDRYTNERSLLLTSEEMSQLNAELVRSNAVLQRSYADIELLVLSIPAVIVGVDTDGRVSRWNRIAGEVLGPPAHHALGRAFTGLAIGWDWAVLGALVGTATACGASRECACLPYRRPDGGDGFLQVSINPSATGHDQALAYILLANDITERRHLEEQSNHLMKMDSIGQLAAGIAHEINTPIQFIGDNLRFLHDSAADLARLIAAHSRLLSAARAGAVTPALVAEVDAQVAASDTGYLLAEIPKAIAQSLEGTGRVAQIVRAMKEFSHAGQGEKEPVDLNHVLTTVLTVARSEYKLVADAVTDYAPDLPRVPGAAGELSQVFLNLIVNAAHAIGDRVAVAGRGTITVSTRRDGDHVEVRLADTGTGIPAAVRGSIFAPFFTTKPVGKGTGQGLYIAAGIVRKKHGGTIAFETAAGVGTTFIVRLPIAPGSVG